MPSWIYGDLIQPGPTLLENRQYAYSYDSTYSTATDASYGITTGAAHFWAQWQVPLPQNASSVISSHIYYPYNTFPPASSSLNFIHGVSNKTTRFVSAPNNSNEVGNDYWDTRTPGGEQRYTNYLPMTSGMSCYIYYPSPTTVYAICNEDTRIAMRLLMILKGQWDWSDLYTEMGGNFQSVWIGNIDWLRDTARPWYHVDNIIENHDLKQWNYDPFTFEGVNSLFLYTASNAERGLSGTYHFGFVDYDPNGVGYTFR